LWLLLDFRAVEDIVGLVGVGIKKLEILDYTENSVSFKATIFCSGEDASFSEKSYFIFKDGRWFYDRGEEIA